MQHAQPIVKTSMPIARLNGACVFFTNLEVLALIEDLFVKN